MDTYKSSIQQNINKDESKGTLLPQYVAASVCSMLAFMYGNSVGWTSSAVPQLEEGLLAEGPVHVDQSGWIGGSYCLGALASSPFCGLIADAKGRKFAAYIIGAAFAINWAIILGCDTLLWILVARVFAGAASGGSMTVVSIYNSEIAEPRLRSSLGGIMALLYVMGIFTAFVLGAYVEYYTIALIYLLVCLLWFPVWWRMPESPPHLILHGKDKNGLEALVWLMGKKGNIAQPTYNRLKCEQAGAIKAATIKEFFCDPAAKRGMVYTVTLISLQTFTGVFAINNYASSIFSRAGGLTPATGTIIYGVFMIIGAVIPPLVADKAPRKTLLWSSTGLVGICTGIFGGYQLMNSLDLLPQNWFIAWIPAITLSACVFFYYIGLGSVTYISINELFSDENRGIGGAFVAIAMWATSFLLLFAFGIFIQAFGDYVVFFIFSSFAALGVMFIYYFIPETRGRSVPEIQRILRERALGKTAVTPVIYI